LYAVDFCDKWEQDALMGFVRMVASDGYTAADLRTMRWQTPINKFMRKVSALSERQMRAIEKCEKFAEAAKSANAAGELALLVRELNGSKDSLSAIEAQIEAAVAVINSNVPFIFPLKMSPRDPRSILRLRGKIRTLGPSMVLLRMQTRGCGDWEYYVLQRSENANGFHFGPTGGVVWSHEPGRIPAGDRHGRKDFRNASMRPETLSREELTAAPADLRWPSADGDM
jgi:hypothetical protein